MSGRRSRLLGWLFVAVAVVGLALRAAYYAGLVG